MPVIAQLRGLFTQLRESVIAWLTQSAGHVFQEPTTQRGNPTSVETTPQLQPQPAPTQPSPKNEPVQQTTAGQRHGSVSLIAQALAANPSILAGFKLEVPAPQTPQPAKRKRKPSKPVASKTKPAAKRSRAKAPAQTPTAKKSGRTGK